jgi:hypothetical protein
MRDSRTPGSRTQNYLRLLDCLRLLLDIGADQVFSVCECWMVSALVGCLADSLGTNIRRERSSVRAASTPPMSMPAALVAGRALRVPTGSAFGRPFPRPTAVGRRQVVESGRECGDKR